MRKILSSPIFAVLLLSLAAGPLLFAQGQPQTPTQPLGIIVKAIDASIGNAPAQEGTSIFSGDYVSTHDNGSLLLRMGSLSLQLEASSGLHIYSAPYGAVAELNHGTVIYTTAGAKENVVIVASDVRVTPDISMADLGRVTIDNPCEVSAYSQRGQANVQSGKESHLIEQGKAYHVRADNKISYREYLSPDASDYHRHHEHEPCAPVYLTHARGPLAPAQSHFVLGAAALIGAGAGIAGYKSLESPDKP